MHLAFNRRIATRVEDLTRHDLFDDGCLHGGGDYTGRSVRETGFTGHQAMSSI
jgi:hypothetical protein